MVSLVLIFLAGAYLGISFLKTDDTHIIVFVIFNSDVSLYQNLCIRKMLGKIAKCSLWIL